MAIDAADCWLTAGTCASTPTLTINAGTQVPTLWRVKSDETWRFARDTDSALVRVHSQGVAALLRPWAIDVDATLAICGCQQLAVGAVGNRLDHRPLHAEIQSRRRYLFTGLLGRIDRTVHFSKPTLERFVLTDIEEFLEAVP